MEVILHKPLPQNKFRMRYLRNESRIPTILLFSIAVLVMGTTFKLIAFLRICDGIEL